jgi:hypothetical protein
LVQDEAGIVDVAQAIALGVGADAAAGRILDLEKTLSTRSEG